MIGPGGFMTAPKRQESECRHIWSPDLCCDGREHYFPCVLEGCNARRYFSKHTRHVGDQRKWGRSNG